MSLRILFADDSVTAQNMGKKILMEAGYEVVAVSNGAAAVKKIAEQKPDIIILDVYMPGYTGLEVCEKVRASAATVKTPVLLTVGKMEPYKPEDARRVRADGVIIKPFEASDLLAIIKKFEERISQNAPPPPPPPVVEEPVEEMPVTPLEHAEHHDPHPNRNMQPMVEVPDHMASTSAFSDLLGGDHAHAMPNLAPPPPPPAVQSAPGPAPTPIQETEIPVSWRPDVEPQPIMVTEAPPPAPVPVTAAPEAAPEPISEPEPVSAPPIVVATVAEPETEAAPAPIPPGPVPGRPKQIPVYQEPEAGSEPEMVPTAAGPVGDIDIPREAQLQESAEEITRETVADVREPALVTAQQTGGPVASAAPVASVSQPSAVSEPAVSHVIAPVTEISAGPRREVADADFEARVAAALAAYGHQAAGSRTSAAVETPPAPASLEPPPAAAAAPSFEYRPPVTAPEPQPTPAEPIVAAAPPIAEPVPVPEPAAIVAEPVQAEPVSASVNHDEVVAKLEETLPAAAAAVAKAAGGEHDTIAEAVNRVMERMKGDLVEEIVRELKSKK